MSSEAMAVFDIEVYHMFHAGQITDTDVENEMI